MNPLQTPLFLGCLAVAACSSRMASTAATPPKGAMSSAVSIDAQTHAVLPSADVVFIGEVLALHASPGIWSGRAIAYQRVEYHVLRVFKSSPKIPTIGKIAILHPIIARSPTADLSEPRLHPERFRVGTHLLIAAKLDEDDGAVQAVDADRSASAWNEGWLSEVERTLREQQ